MRLLLLCAFLASLVAATAANFLRDVDITWGGPRAKILDGGRHLSLSLDKDSGSGFQSKKQFLFGRFDVQMMLVPGNSAGTVTTFYVSSDYLFLLTTCLLSVWFSHKREVVLTWYLFSCVVVFWRNESWWDWLWILRQFIGRSIHTPHQCVLPRKRRQRTTISSLVWSHKGLPHLLHWLVSTKYHVILHSRQTFELDWWFGLIKRSYVWTPIKTNQTFSISFFIRFLVDNIPIRVFHNWEKIGVSYPKSQPMKVYSSLWNADDWATRGGRVKTDWTKAPFTASYRNFNANGCVASTGSSSSCSSKYANTQQGGTKNNQGLDAKSRNRLRWVQSKFMVYNYCTDRQRFPQGIPAECRRSRFLWEKTWKRIDYLIC